MTLMMLTSDINITSTSITSIISENQRVSAVISGETKSSLCRELFVSLQGRENTCSFACYLPNNEFSLVLVEEPIKPFPATSPAGVNISPTYLV